MKGFATVFFLFTTIFYSQSLGVTFTKHAVVDTLSKPRQAVAVDLDNDGDLDIVGIKDGDGYQGLCWQNDGFGNFGEQKVVYKSYNGGRSVAAGDIDGDGDNDIVIGSLDADSSIVWYENNGNPFGGAWKHHFSGGKNEICYSLFITDIDNDGKMDIAAAYTSGDDIVWLKNNGGDPLTFTEFEVDGLFKAALGVTVTNVNGSGNLDLIGASWWDEDYAPYGSDGFKWWEFDGESTYTPHIISSMDSAGLVFAKDLNRDGYVDVIGATVIPLHAGNIIWWSNDGSGLFSTDNIINSHKGLASIYARDLEGDGDIDIISSSDQTDSLFWLENNGFQFFTENTIMSGYYGARFVGAHDFDGDGDPDILSVALGGTNTGDISWFENDAEDEQVIVSGESSLFWNDKVEIIVNSSSGGTNDVTVFYDSEEVPNTDSCGPGIKTISKEGFYTLATGKTIYNTTLKFSYSGITQWNYVSSGWDERDLIICTWDSDAELWVKAGTSQHIDMENDTITVAGVTQFGRFVLAEAASVEANIAVFLEGPYSGGSMSTSINAILPKDQPYSGSPWNYSGSESVASIPSGVVDWILVELRTGSSSDTKVANRAAFLKSNGSIVDLDGSNQVHFSGIEDGNYYLVVHHRNHLAVMSANAQALSEGSSTLYNFTTGSGQFYGTGGAKDLGSGVWGMYGGEGNYSGIVSIADRNAAISERDAVGYNDRDYNLSGIVTISDANLALINRDAATQVP